MRFVIHCLNLTYIESSLSASPRGRTCFNATREHARKVALIGEPRQQGDFGQRHPGIEHKLLRALDSLLQQPLVRSASDRLLERLTEVTR